MNIQRTLRSGKKIARATWTAHRRERGTPLGGNRVQLAVLLAATIGLGWIAYSTGHSVGAGTTVPDDRVRVFASGAFAWMVWRSSQYAKVRFERLDSDLLLTTVPARTVVVGFLGFVCTRLSVTLIGPTLGVAVGAGAGLESLSVVVSIPVGVSAMG